MDFEKVSSLLLSLVQQLNGLESLAVHREMPPIEGVAEFLIALDAFRHNVGDVIMEQGNS